MRWRNALAALFAILPAVVPTGGHGFENVGAGSRAEALVRSFPGGIAKVKVVNWTSSWVGTLPAPPETTTYGCVEVNRLLAIARAENEAPRRYPPLFVHDMGCGELRFSMDPLLMSATVSGTLHRRALR